eukprot:scaffold22512_cov36-Phaeocystis_antarctica.AAC.2
MRRRAASARPPQRWARRCARGCTRWASASTSSTSYRAPRPWPSCEELGGGAAAVPGPIGVIF